jgi:hypothetical protein
MSKTKIALGLGIAFCLTFIAAYAYVRLGGAYQAATNFCKTNQEIVQSVGGIRDMRLPFFGHDFHLSGARGVARLNIEISGNTQDATANIELDKVGSFWSVRSALFATADGKVIRVLDHNAKPSSANEVKP